MSAVEHKSRAEVIEWLLSHRGQLKEQETDQGERHYPFPIERCTGGIFGKSSRKNHCSDLNSSKELSLWQRPQSAPNSPSCMSSAR
jgi:hypothetical protein